MKTKIKAASIPEEKGDVVLADMKAVYLQHEDDLSDNRGNYHELTIETADAGAGGYLVIKTERWAIENADDITNLIEDFKLRLEKK